MIISTSKQNNPLKKLATPYKNLVLAKVFAFNSSHVISFASIKPVGFILHIRDPFRFEEMYNDIIASLTKETNCKVYENSEYSYVNYNQEFDDVNFTSRFYNTCVDIVTGSKDCLKSKNYPYVEEFKKKFLLELLKVVVEVRWDSEERICLSMSKNYDKDAEEFLLYTVIPKLLNDEERENIRFTKHKSYTKEVIYQQSNGIKSLDGVPFDRLLETVTFIICYVYERQKGEGSLDWYKWQIK